MIKRYTDYVTEKLIQPQEDLLETIKGVIKKVKKELVVKEAKEEKGGYAVITTDHLDGEYKDKVIKLPENENLTRKRFKLYDDDNELYYSGYFYDDESCDNQDELLSWAMNDSGCTLIKVAVGNGAFEVEIG